MTFAPQRSKPQPRPANLRGASILLAIGLVAMALPFFGPKPQGSPAFIVIWLACWAFAIPLVLIGLWGVVRGLWQQGRGPFDPPA